MPDNTLTVQAAVVAALRASTALAGLVGTRIYDRIPENQPQAYVALASWAARNDGTDCFDASTVDFMVLAYSDKPGRKEVADIADAVVAALNRLQPAGAEVLWTDTNYGAEQGLLSVASVRFQALCDG